ncbi:MAG TPA: phospholipase D family protein [Tepidisphaeraceae bacterium]|nr:phospholipase D family protein [Tepidisphaeraceae bacterium]
MRASIPVRIVVLLHLVLLGGLCFLGAAPAAEKGNIAVWFSPDGGCAETIIEAIRGADRSLDIAIYHLTHPDIAKAIADAHRRRVSVRVIMDKAQSQASYSAATYLNNSRVPVFIWQKGLMHHKFVIVDGEHVFTGSFNFTKAAESSNAENLVLIKDTRAITRGYLAQFEVLISQSKRYKQPNDR